MPIFWFSSSSSDISFQDWIDLDWIEFRNHLRMKMSKYHLFYSQSKWIYFYVRSFIFPNLDKVSTIVVLYALQLPRTIGMLEKATDPCWGLQDYTKNTLVHFSYTICTNIAQYYLYLHSKRKMPLIHTPPFSLRHDV